MADDGAVATLVSMGFDAPSAQSALKSCGGNMERAVEVLLGGGGGGDGGGAPSSSSSASVIRCDSVSQYSVPDGRSACTCIALSAADAFLSAVEGSEGGDSARSVLTPSFLSEVVNAGVRIYGTLRLRSAGGGSAEHMSAEEVLSSETGRTAYSSLGLLGGVRQGVLSSAAGSDDSPLGLRAQLVGVLGEASPSEWTAALITKTPETVVCILPPGGGEGGSGGIYALIDSHPRPHLGTGEGSYVAIYDNLDGLLGMLRNLFPATDLGPDVGDMMAMMYNSFDLYAMRRAK
uniref:UBA domain-containing protein n=1 Tax=Trieres chinensis TaxID=1514140 RepID=A0A7S2A6W4_TRICV